MKQVGDADTQNDPVAHARARHDRTQLSTVSRAGAKKNSNSNLKTKSTQNRTLNGFKWILVFNYNNLFTEIGAQGDDHTPIENIIH